MSEVIEKIEKEIMALNDNLSKAAKAAAQEEVKSYTDELKEKLKNYHAESQKLADSVTKLEEEKAELQKSLGANAETIKKYGEQLSQLEVNLKSARRQSRIESISDIMQKRIKDVAEREEDPIDLKALMKSSVGRTVEVPLGKEFSRLYDMSYNAEERQKAIVAYSTNLVNDRVAEASEIKYQPFRREHIRPFSDRGGVTSSNYYGYGKVTVRNDNTEFTSDVGAATKTDMTVAWAEEKVKDIRQSTDVARNALDDIPGFATFMTGQLREMYMSKLDTMILKGTGTGEEWTGLFTGASNWNRQLMQVAAANDYEVLVNAAAQGSVLHFQPTLAFVGVNDFFNMSITRSQERYLLYERLGIDPTRQLQIIPTTAMDDDEFLVIDPLNATEFIDRLDMSFEISTENKDNYDKRMATIAINGRYALPSFFTGAMVKGTFSAAKTAFAA
ncbi:MAG: phage major capsid protein [Cyclobacteriaceae bacterium]